ncbi:hypothetical protein DFS34DRAFT_395362 [Phlyctochytrium arcticum]|nr:hypothetical protein DFS34DRAFT_395362 [Phlyctochytrium arcticum]
MTVHQSQSQEDSGNAGPTSQATSAPFLSGEPPVASGPPPSFLPPQVGGPPASGYGTPPPSSGYGTPPPTFPPSPSGSALPPPPQGPPARGTYSAYPEHLRNAPPSQGNFQGNVAGLNGWNDLPAHMLSGMAGKKKASSAGSNSGASTPAATAVIQDPFEALSGVTDPAGHIVAAFVGAMERVRLKADPSQKRMVEDTSKRLDTLYERLSANAIPQHVLGTTVQLASALVNEEYSTCNSITTSLMTGSFDQEGKWLLGAKRLIELCQKL